MAFYEIDGVRPIVHPSAYVHPTAILIGDVTIGPNCYIAPMASLRGDFGRIVIGPGSNVQDNCTMHAFPGLDAVIEEDGHVGHGAILHGCVLKRNTLIGMNSVVMDGAVIGEDSVVAAMAFVKAGFAVPPRTMVGGVPARIMRELTDEDIAWQMGGTATYKRLTERCLATMKECAPLAEAEAGRKGVDAGNAKPRHLARKR